MGGVFVGVGVGVGGWVGMNERVRSVDRITDSHHHPSLSPHSISCPACWLLQVWISYADRLEQPGDIFKVRDKGIQSTHTPSLPHPLAPP